MDNTSIQEGAEMLRRIIEIDKSKCNGCGLCAKACHEGAIAMYDGVANLIRDDYCDGLGDCLPECPTGAISFTVRQAEKYDEQAVLDHKRRMEKVAEEPATSVQSQLTMWPVQIKLVNPQSAFFDGADVLIAASCTAYAYGNFHTDFIRGKAVLIGCTKLDAVDYSEKLTTILSNNRIQSVTLAIMEVPCCGGMEFAVKKALENSGKSIPLTISVIANNGEILKTSRYN